MSTPLDERETAKRMDSPQPPRPAHNEAARPASNGVPPPASLSAVLRRLPLLGGRFGTARRSGSAGSGGDPFAPTRQRLVTTNMIAVALVLAVLSTVVYVFNVRSTQQEIDAQLAHYADFTAMAVDEDHLPPPGSNQGPQGGIAPYAPSSPDLFTVVLDPSGTTRMDGDHIQQLGVPVVAAARPVLDGLQSVAATTVHAAGHDFRLYAVAAMHDGKLAAVVVEGVSLDVQDQQQVNLLRALALVFAVVLALTLLTSLYFTERALRPARAAFARQRQFAAAASHELRTPLAVIRSEAELAGSLISDSLDALRRNGGAAAAANDSDAAVTSQLEESLGETRAITAEVDYMTRMANELLLLARDAADTRAHEWREVDLRAVLRSVTDNIRPLAAREGLALETSGVEAAEPLWVRGDPDLLRQLVYGLLDNAVRYTPEGGGIRVAVRSEHHRRVTLTIGDTGVGIAPEHLTHIFEPFYRAISARPRRQQQVGTGLGLALADWVVRAHGGTIAVRSIVGEGTSFIVELPLAHGVHTDQSEPSSPVAGK